MTPPLTPDAQALSVQVHQPQVPAGQEPSKDAPLSEEQKNKDLLAKWGKKLIDATVAKRESWQWKRRGIVLKVLKNKEMLKGNQHLGTFPGSYETFDAFEQFDNFLGIESDKNGDRSMDRRPHNFYQTLEIAYEAALSAQVPKTRARPANADEEDDRETARVFSRIEEIIERANKIKTMLRQELMEFFTSGCYFKHTRYVVDAERTGTHKETTVSIRAHAELLPARYQCFQCGETTTEDDLIHRSMNGPTGQHTQLACPNCGTPFSQENYFENYVDPDGVPVAEQKQDVPNGMVLQSIYGPLHIDADPDAPDLANTCLLNLAQEVSLGWLRLTFKENWRQFSEGQSSGNTSEQMERLLRDIITAPQGYPAWFGGSQSKPTYNRTFIQPMLFAELPGDEDGKQAEQLLQDFPQGCMLAWVADHPLYIRAAKLTDEWTWAGTRQKGFGLFPAPAGDPAVPLQEKLNDCHAKIDEYLDRLAFGFLLANEEYVDTKGLNGKPMLAGVLNPLKIRKTHPNSDIRNMIFQVKAEIDALVVNYIAILKQEMELLVGTPPQTFGAGTQEGVETKGGQEQQLNTGMMKLGMHWEVIGDEHGEAAENAVKCASKNMTEDWQNQVADEKQEWRAEYVHLDQVKGSVLVERDTEQGFPMTQAEIRAFWKDVMTNPENPFVQALLDVPSNVDACIRSLGVPGVDPPKGAVFGKMLRYVSQLLDGQASTQPDPITGEPLQVPSVQPNKYLDDCATLVKFIPAWCDKHWDRLEGNQPVIDNFVAFYKMCVVYEKEIVTDGQMMGPGGPGAPGGAPPQGQPAMAGAQA